MSDSLRSTESSDCNEQSLRKLVRAIALSEGQFSLILVRYNNLELRDRAVEVLSELCPLHIRSLVLPESAISIYSTIRAELAGEQPQVLMIFGLESVNTLERAIASMNGDREEFRQHFAFPVVFWVNDEIWLKLSRLASDFKNWGGVSIKLAIASN